MSMIFNRDEPPPSTSDPEPSLPVPAEHGVCSQCKSCGWSGYIEDLKAKWIMSGSGAKLVPACPGCRSTQISVLTDGVMKEV